ncbi:N-acetylmuramoyl-L-alanine amidase [Pseudalgibacter alginicilyticus]|uniref:N-acetylmuramoyl-L-alanine amidase n=1 Tax=Pseudalgibacter alginicilyticus TaxID=1736674 RepID=A0A0P0CE90_9FLAO|nr:N-acetylmuramoyl-L-alanine amidase [Pseudalgibacter alginicilyticus]ALJ04290.1 N-acetylmuramoyl-L-alanine amidase [Pseudalgibacter alginicilyticus]
MQTHKVLLFVSYIIVLTFSLFKRVEAQSQSEKFVVVLDAGHGGKDSGNTGNGYKEKDIALKIVLAIGAELDKNPNIKVVYTRKTDVFVELSERGDIANRAQANLFVSVHCNAHHSQAYGTETFVLGVHKNQSNFEVAKRENSVIFLENDHESKYAGFNPNSPESVISIIIGQEEYLEQSITLASLIQDNFTNKLKRHNRNVKQAGFFVLHRTVMPSVLVEVGFLTNKSEGAYLNSSKGQREMANSIKDAILDYKKFVDQNVGDNVLMPEDIIEEKEVSHSKTTFENIIFKVQIAASSRKLALKPYNFNGLEDVSSYKQGNLYKYYYGNTSDYNNVQSLEKTAQAKGYTSSFIVAFKDNKQIPLSEALKTPSN